MKFFLKLKSNYIEKLNIETRFGTIVTNEIVRGKVLYDLGYDIQSLNLAICFKFLIFFG